MKKILSDFRYRAFNLLKLIPLAALTAGVTNSQDLGNGGSQVSDGEAWKVAQQTGTVAAYSEFILNFPQSAHTTTALCFLQEMGVPVFASTDASAQLNQGDFSECAVITSSSSRITNI